MPAGQPVLGELWETLDTQGRAVRGIISDVTPTTVTLVSFTGNRHRIAPDRLPLNWTFTQSAPRTPFVCSRRGCSLPAVFRYTRGTSPDYTCPRHAPAGTRMALLSDQPGAPQSQPAPTITIASPCPNCGNPDPVEIWSGVGLLPEISGWSCVRCNNTWASVLGGANPSTSGQWWREAIATITRETERHNFKRQPSQIRCHPTVGSVLLSEFETVVINGVPTLYGIPIEVDGALDPWTMIVHTGVNHRIASLQQQVLAAARSLDDSGDLEELESQLVHAPSRWVHKGTGMSVETVAVRDGAVSFRQEEQTFTMLLEDFVKFHRPFVLDGVSTEPAPNIAIQVGEEWESAEGTVKIVSVDSKREQVVVTWADSRKRSAPLTLREFATDKWRKVVRKTSFQRLLDLDEDDD